MPAIDRPAPARLGYLLKHAYLGYEALTERRLEPLGIAPHEWAALNCLDAQPGLSQREVSELLGIDRTRMVALVDALQAHGWVQRRPQPDDRRKNIPTLTAAGRRILQRGGRVIDDCERQFLAVLEGPGAERLLVALDAVVDADR